MVLQQAAIPIFQQLSESLKQLSQDEYVKPSHALFGNTIGQHVRHIIELYQCLDEGYESGTVNYENRKRDLVIETNKLLAVDLLRKIYDNLQKPDKSLVLVASYDEISSEPITIQTNYYREIAYNLEHAIHHMALIRVGLSEVSNVEVPEEFGVAGSTVKYRRTCAQ